MNKNAPFRVRIAPSPTGDPHVGTLRMALYNFLLAKQNKGAFVLRIEDTDKSREQAGAIEKIEESLSWIGTIPDEGIAKGGQFGPYKQSDRLDLYHQYADQLVKDGHAYYCFCSAERLEKLRHDQEADHKPPRYDRYCRKLTKDEVKTQLDKNEPHVIRMKVPDGQTINWHDEIKGDISFASDEVDDQVLLKSDGFPTYHLACVVDDHLMAITLVLRGEEWLSSTPKHLLLYQYFGWVAPQFAHSPLILNTDRSKLSKRNNNTSVLYYKVDCGYHPMAMIHFLMFLGWTPKEVQDSYTMDLLIDQFSLDRVGNSPAIFDLAKLDFLGRQYLVAEPLDTLSNMFMDWLTDSRHSLTDHEKQFIVVAKSEPVSAYIMIDVVRQRAHNLAELSKGVGAFFNDKAVNQILVDDLTLDERIPIDQVKQALSIVRKGIADLNIKDAPETVVKRVGWLTNYFRKLQPTELNGQSYLHPTRVAITGERQSMNMFEYLAGFLALGEGKSIIIKRLDNALRLVK